MSDFSSFEFSSTKSGLCVAIFIFALRASLADIFRIHTVFHSHPGTPINSGTKKSFLFALALTPNREVDWEIRPLTGKDVSISILIVPVLAMSLIATSSTGSIHKQSAIQAGISL
jgi:hypothetical protein